MFEADIKLSPEQEERFKQMGVNVGVEKRKGIKNLANLWPKAVVPYAIDPSRK